MTMFDHYTDSYMNGHFRVAIDSKELPNGEWEASYTSPWGETVTATSTDQIDAHRQCAEKVREGVLKREIQLGR
jgi:hypothetical protein